MNLCIVCKDFEGKRLKFNYYYGIEAEQFSFYRVPRLLVKDKRFRGLSSDAKLLYGLMLERIALSVKNGWLDDEREGQRYTYKSICLGETHRKRFINEIIKI